MPEDAADRDARLQLVLDRDAIRDVVARSVRAVDRLDADLLTSTYHPDGVEDHHGTTYSGATIGEDVTRVQRERMVMTSLHITTQIIEVDGDRAGVESYYLGLHQPVTDAGPVRLLSSGRMLDELERRAGEWRILTRRVIPDTARLLPWAEELDVGEQPTRRDRTDPSYVVLDVEHDRPDDHG
jgi:hypothetical protein